MTHRILGIVGKKGSGKDTTGEYLIEKYGYIRFAFGDKVKEASRTLFNFTDEQLYGSLKDKIDNRYGLKPREVFQRLGTEFGQFDIHKLFPELNKKIARRSFWTLAFKEFCQKHPDKNIVITDVRFRHEFNIIKEMGGEFIKIERDGLILDDHISENELSSIEFERILDNNYEKVDLYSQIDVLILVPF